MCDTAGRPNHDKDWQELVTTLASLYDSNAMKITYKKNTQYISSRRMHGCVCCSQEWIVSNNTVNY
jgi:hypothetical protein